MYGTRILYAVPSLKVVSFSKFTKITDNILYKEEETIAK